MQKLKIAYLVMVLFVPIWLSACFDSGSDSKQTHVLDVTVPPSIPGNEMNGDTVKAEQTESKNQIQDNTEDRQQDNIQEPDTTNLIASTQKKIEKPKKPKRPSITFKETTHEFDEITTGDIINVRFDFRNDGNAPLVVKSATATCGCTVPSYPFIPIEPGENGFIGVTYNSVGKLGEQKASITIITNANPSKYVLHLLGNVLEKKKKE